MFVYFRYRSVLEIITLRALLLIGLTSSSLGLHSGPGQKMADNTLDHLVLRSSSGVSLNDRFSKVLEAPAPGEVKLEPLVDDLCLDDEVRTVLPMKNGPQQRLTRVAPPGAQRGGGGPRPRVLTRLGGAPLSSAAALEDRLLGGRRCPCALWGLRLLSRRHGWAGGAVLGARPIRRAGYTPNPLRRRWLTMVTTGTTSVPAQTNAWTSANPAPVRTNAWQQPAPKQGWKAQFRRKVPSKEVLDRQLDDYMSKSKRYLDAQLDAYMAQAGDRDDADDDDRKLYDDDDRKLYDDDDRKLYDDDDRKLYDSDDRKLYDSDCAE
ncbi:unnamed protein product [Arctogadus glacialis]